MKMSFLSELKYLLAYMKVEVWHLVIFEFYYNFAFQDVKNGWKY